MKMESNREATPGAGRLSTEHVPPPLSIPDSPVTATAMQAFSHELAAERRQTPGLWATLTERPNTIRAVSVVVFLAVWEIVASRIDPLLFAGPSGIARAFWRLTVSGELPSKLYISLTIFFIGLLIASLIGVITGLAMGRYRVVEYLLDPYINALYATPRIALVPLLIL